MSTTATSAIGNLPDQTSTFLNPPEAKIRTTGTTSLGVNDFLKLITVQLTNQDPMKPMEDTQFISQMASFTSLEQMQTLSKDVRQSSAQDYLGKTVTVSNGQGKTTGVVTGVNYSNGASLLTINGNNYDFSTVLSVSNTPAVPTTTPSSQTSNSSAN